MPITSKFEAFPFVRNRFGSFGISGSGMNNMFRRPESRYDPSTVIPSPWPLSQLRSSMSPGDESPEGTEIETFERHWEGDRVVEVPYQERIIRNLTGRTMQESFSKMNKCRYPNLPPGSSLGGSSDAQDLRERYPYHLYGELDSSVNDPKSTNYPGESSQGTVYSDNATVVPKSSRTTPETRCDSHMDVDKVTEAAATILHSPIDEEKDSLLRSVGLKEMDGRPAASPPPMVITAGAMGLPPQRARHVFGHRPLSQVITPAFDHRKEENRRLVRRRSAPSFLDIDQSEGEENDSMDLFHDSSSPKSSSTVPKIRTIKHKSSQQRLHLCTLCNKSFTRNFDLQRHNQKHKAEPLLEDKARRTCPNCNRLLSRVDAAKRHVDTLPDSCNNNRKKEGMPLLDPMPQSHYDACKARYYKLAEETKKPKGRKKANPAPVQ